MVGPAHDATLQRPSRRIALILRGGWPLTGVELWVYWPHARLLKAARALQHLLTVSSLCNATVAILPFVVSWATCEQRLLPTSPLSAAHVMQKSC